VNFVVAATTLAVVLPAELPDKSALASLMLGSRYRPAYVFAGVTVAFAAHVALALVADGLLALLPHRVLSAIVAVLFGVGAILLVKGRGEEDAVDKATAGTPPTFDSDRDREPGRPLPRPAGRRDRVAGRVVGVGGLAIAGGRGLPAPARSRTFTAAMWPPGHWC